MTIKKEALWNGGIAAVCTALLAALGYLFLSVSELKEKQAAEDAAEAVANATTDVVNDIDKRLSLIENNQQWMMRQGYGPSPNNTGGLDNDLTNIFPMMAPTPPAPAEEEEDEDGSAPDPQEQRFRPRYDIRQQALPDK